MHRTHVGVALLLGADADDGEQRRHGSCGRHGRALEIAVIDAAPRAAHPFPGDPLDRATTLTYCQPRSSLRN